MNELGRIPAYVSRYWRPAKPHATCLNCGQKFYHIIAHAMKCQGKEVIMSEQNQSLYARYKKAVRSCPEAYVVIKTDEGLVAFDQECSLFSYALNVNPKPVNGHLQLTLTPAQAKRLKQEFDFDLLEV